MTKAETFDDEDFVSWAARPEWSPTQAIFVLQGKNPPPNDLSPEELDKELPASRNLPNLPKEHSEAWINHPSNWVRFAHSNLESSEAWINHPSNWVRFAHSNLESSALSKSWEAIFPESIPRPLNSIIDEEPDYRQFIGAISHGHMMQLDELVSFAMCTRRKAQRANEREAATIAMGSRLDITENNVVDLGNRLVSVLEFVERYPKTIFPLDERCEFWSDWVRAHSGIVGWLSGHTGAKSPLKPEVEYSATSAQWTFRKASGNKWEVGPEGSSVVIKGGKGAADFAVAVRTPGYDCLRAIMGWDAEVYVPTYGSDDMMDGRFAAELQQEIDNLTESLDMARNEGSRDLGDEYETELQRLLNHQKKSTRPGFKSKRLDAGDPMRLATNRLRDRKRTLIGSISAAGFDDIADHVKKCFKIADRSVIYYASHPAISWVLD